MSRHPELYQWIAYISTHFPHLSKALATSLALRGFGMIVARSCSLNAVAGILAPLLGQSFNTMRERLRDTYREADAKNGDSRAQLDLSSCWAPWLAWMLDGWSGQTRNSSDSSIPFPPSGLVLAESIPALILRRIVALLTWARRAACATERMSIMVH